MESTDVTRTASPGGVHRRSGTPDLLPSSIRCHDGNASTHSLAALDVSSEDHAEVKSPESERTGHGLYQQETLGDSASQYHFSQLKASTTAATNADKLTRKRLRDEEEIERLEGTVKAKDQEIKKLRLDNHELQKENKKLRGQNQALEFQNKRLQELSQQESKIMEASDDPRPNITEAFKR